MFGIDSSELAVIALVALIVIGPKDLPRVMRSLGQWLAKGRAMSRHVRSGFDTMMREAELEEMQKAWAAQNEAIMKATAMPDLGLADPMAQLGQDDWTTPAPPLQPEAPSPPPKATATTPEAPAPPPEAPAPPPEATATTPEATATPPEAMVTPPARAPRKRAAKAPKVVAATEDNAATKP